MTMGELVNRTLMQIVAEMETYDKCHNDITTVITENLDNFMNL